VSAGELQRAGSLLEEARGFLLVVQQTVAADNGGVRKDRYMEDLAAAWMEVVV
jgi:hypothetical protein